MILVALDNSKPTSRNDLSWEHGLATAVTAGTTNIIVCVPFVPTWAAITVLLILVYSVVIVWDNGRSGFHGEHSCLDGIPTLRMNESMLGSLDANEIYLGNPLPSISLTPPKEIILTADDAVHADIQDAMRNFDKLVDAHELRVLHYEGLHQAVQDLARCVGTARESARVLQAERAARGYIRERADAEIPARANGSGAASSQSKARVGVMINPRAMVRIVLAATRDVSLINWVLGLD
jgi:carnitine O-acetyltransferase